MEIIGYFALIGIGIVLATAGGGGSVFSLPVLVYLFSLDVVTASSYSMFIVGTTSLLGAWLNKKAQWIDLRSGLIFSASSVVAIWFTRQLLLPSIPEEVNLFDGLSLTKRALILGVYAFLAIVSSTIILSKIEPDTTSPGSVRIEILVPVGFAIGILAGFVGIGGGFLILPSLIAFGRLSFRTAIGTTLLVIGCNSLVGFLGDVFHYRINWVFLLFITSLAAFGMLLGNHYSKKVPVHQLRTLFAWIIGAVATGILIDELLFLIP